MKHMNRVLMFVAVVASFGVTNVYSAVHVQTDREITDSNPELAPNAPGSDTDVDTYVNRSQQLMETTDSSANQTEIFTPYRESINTTDSSATIDPNAESDVDLGASSSGRGR
jgi:hypothetical protein